MTNSDMKRELFFYFGNIKTCMKKTRQLQSPNPNGVIFMPQII